MLYKDIRIEIEHEAMLTYLVEVDGMLVSEQKILDIFAAGNILCQ